MKKAVAISFLGSFLTAGVLSVSTAFGAGPSYDFIVSPVDPGMELSSSKDADKNFIYGVKDTVDIGKIFLKGGYTLVKKFAPLMKTDSRGLPNGLYEQTFLLRGRGIENKPPFPVVVLSFDQVADTANGFYLDGNYIQKHFQGVREVSFTVSPENFSTEKTLATALDEPKSVDPAVKNYNSSNRPSVTEDAKTEAMAEITEVAYGRQFSYSSGIHAEMRHALVSSGFRDMTPKGDSTADAFNTSATGPSNQYFFWDKTGDVRLTMKVNKDPQKQDVEHVTIVYAASTVATLDEKAAALRAIFHTLSIH